MILLIDNRDSYTFNLAHLLATHAGEEPLVVGAEDVEKLGIPARIRAGEFTHIVISPGPGHPGKAADFAGAKRVIEAADGVPLLGVCLGHQGLAMHAGAKVIEGTPHHGVVSTLQHSGEGLFRGLPQDFEVVRYHSLHVAEPLPSQLCVHARSSDGVVQAIEHRNQPHWGVQFHPESVLTEYGSQLIARFLQLRPRPVLKVLHRAHHLQNEIEHIFQSLSINAEQCFWLDDATKQSWSILGTNAGSLSTTIAGESTLDELNTKLTQTFDRSAVPPEVPFAGGYVGYLAYPRPKEHGVWLMPQSFVAVDHTSGTAHCMVLYHDAPDEEAWSLLNSLEAALDAHGPSEVEPAAVLEGAWRYSRGEYLARIAEVKRYLASGDSYEVCLTDTWEGTCTGSSTALYGTLRRHNPAPYAAYLRLDTSTEIEVLCSSPERFLKVSGGVVSTKPIKGTAPSSTDPQELRLDAKTRQENLMIVDLLRNDLSRVCNPGSVQVPRLMEVETFAGLHQLVSTVTGQLRSTAAVTDLIDATFPGGSMTGAPKARTLDIIDELEAGPRGIYSGTIGYLGFDGNADLNIIIRTAVKRGNQITIGAGGAIVWDSDPAAEYTEKQLKADAVLQGLVR
ncbi:aminodeoxychorismate synthase components I/II [Corynebacterium sp. NML140438]|uniref:chorismate-binding protein n=1 Tax=Corynebacterium sp. NML140438 TaxID=1906334 RepID=UPI0008FBB181|nr:chorismate-binding protein [Corynebacterium sp. NML140438]OIR42557.1 aminodeoxychorismate synthase components I/II [Corynebacterium sp. NML140438]